MATSTLIVLALAFFTIACLYASVGFGGGSSYLAILSLYVQDFLAIKTTGLLCNLAVVSGGTYLFGKSGYFDWRKSLPIALSGVPFAFYAATMHLSYQVFFISLGVVLSVSGILLLLQILLHPERNLHIWQAPMMLNVLLGAGIGFLSGLVGIGGGILLSPLLNLMHWDNPKKIAALASFFILLNSVAGLAGQLASGTFTMMPALPVLLLAVLLGGQLGTRISIHAIRPAIVKGLTGILVCYIGARLMLKYTNGLDI